MRLKTNSLTAMRTAPVASTTNTNLIQDQVTQSESLGGQPNQIPRQKMSRPKKSATIDCRLSRRDGSSGGTSLLTLKRLFTASFLIGLGSVSSAYAGSLSWDCFNPDKTKPAFTTVSQCESFSELTLTNNNCNYSAISCSATSKSGHFRCTSSSTNCALNSGLGWHSLNSNLIWNIVPTTIPASSSSQTGDKSKIH